MSTPADEPDHDPRPDRADPLPAFFHVALTADWDHAVATGTYRTSTRGATVDEVGFVHGAFADQVTGVVERFYADLDRVVLLTVDPAALDARVVVEPPADGIPEQFPHVYGPIPVRAVTRALTVDVADLLGDVDRFTRRVTDVDERGPGRPTITP